MPPMLNGKGESGQDCFAYAQCGWKTNGTFIDIGCNEPIKFNNTYALEQLGWHGWLIDLNPEYGEAIRHIRRNPFFAVDALTVDWKAMVGSTPLPIDYLSLDIDENREKNLALHILERIFAAGLTFRCMTIEHDAYRHGDVTRKPLRELCLANGYKLAHGDVEIRKGCGKPFEDWWAR